MPYNRNMRDDNPLRNDCRMPCPTCHTGVQSALSLRTWSACKDITVLYPWGRIASFISLTYLHDVRIGLTEFLGDALTLLVRFNLHIDPFPELRERIIQGFYY